MATPNISGNLDLKPETSDSIELVYQHAQGGFYTQVGGYWARMTTRSSGRRARRRRPRRTQRAGVLINGTPFNGTGLEAETNTTDR